MKSKSIRCMKFFLILFNILCIIVGIVLVAVCAIHIGDNKSDLDQSAISRGLISFLLVIGLCLVVTAIIGCICAFREHVKVLYVYASFYIFLVAIELLVVVGGAVLSAWTDDSTELRVEFYRNTTTSEKEVTYHQKYWDKLQAENQCCGVDGPQDYAIINKEIPTSCCARAYPLREGKARRHLHSTCLTEKMYYTHGCEEVVRKQNALRGNIIISISVIFTLLEILCVVLAIWMARTIRSERRKLQANLQAHFET